MEALTQGAVVAMVLLRMDYTRTHFQGVGTFVVEGMRSLSGSILTPLVSKDLLQLEQVLIGSPLALSF